jgi:hypothetical protein
MAGRFNGVHCECGQHKYSEEKRNGCFHGLQIFNAEFVFYNQQTTENSVASGNGFGLRWQSGAATELLTEQLQPWSCFQSGVAFHLPPQSKKFYGPMSF